MQILRLADIYTSHICFHKESYLDLRSAPVWKTAEEIHGCFASLKAEELWRCPACLAGHPHWAGLLAAPAAESRCSHRPSAHKLHARCQASQAVRACSLVWVRWRNTLPSTLSPVGFPLVIKIIRVPMHKRKICIFLMCSICSHSHFLPKQSLFLFWYLGRGIAKCFEVCGED